jgi:hypothetical protein
MTLLFSAGMKNTSLNAWYTHTPVNGEQHRTTHAQMATTEPSLNLVLLLLAVTGPISFLAAIPAHLPVSVVARTGRCATSQLRLATVASGAGVAAVTVVVSGARARTAALLLLLVLALPFTEKELAI